MIEFTAVIIISLIIFVIGWVFVSIRILKKTKTKTGEKFNTVLAITGIVMVAISFGLIFGEKERQVELRPKIFPAKEYTLETIVENNDTTYIITKIVQ